MLTILLTGSINPHGMPDARFNPKERERQYIEALVFYIKNYHSLVQKIIFAENSGWNLDVIKEAVAGLGNIHFVSFNTNDYPRHYGKGYGELSLILDTLDDRELATSTIIIKITGRLKVLNLNKIFSQINHSSLLICDARSVNLTFWKQHHLPYYVDTRLIIFEKSFFISMMKPILQKIDKSRGRHFEQLFYMIAHIHRKQSGVELRLATEPRYSGYAAHGTGRSHDSMHNTIKYYIRFILRNLFHSIEF